MFTTISRFALAVRREPGDGRPSLRTELLFQLACLAAAAVLLALWTLLLLQLPIFGTATTVWLFVLVALDLALFVLLGRYLLDRLVMRPLVDTAAAATAIAGGEHERRITRGQTREMDALAEAVNRLTDQLLQNQEKLAENIRSLDRTNRLLVDAQRDLVQAEKLASIGRLAAGIAHEVGNPLGALIGYAGVLRKRGGETELLEGIEREAARIDRIVRGLLDYARPGSAAREPVDVNATLERVVSMLREQGRLSEVQVELELAPELPRVLAVRHAIEQVWVNLVVNAEVAMAGRGRLLITTRRTQYRSDEPPPSRRADDPPGIDYSHLRRMREQPGPHARRLRGGEEIVQVSVSDDGPGIAHEHAANVFDPFFTTRAPGEGTGLGLAIVASTVADLGGRVELGPLVGAGATFIVSLPVPQESE